MRIGIFERSLGWRPTDKPFIDVGVDTVYSHHADPGLVEILALTEGWPSDQLPGSPRGADIAPGHLMTIAPQPTYAIVESDGRHRLAALLTNLGQGSQWPDEIPVPIGSSIPSHPDEPRCSVFAIYDEEARTTAVVGDSDAGIQKPSLDTPMMIVRSAVRLLHAVHSAGFHGLGFHVGRVRYVPKLDRVVVTGFDNLRSFYEDEQSPSPSDLRRLDPSDRRLEKLIQEEKEAAAEWCRGTVSSLGLPVGRRSQDLDDALALLAEGGDVLNVAETCGVHLPLFHRVAEPPVRLHSISSVLTPAAESEADELARQAEARLRKPAKVRSTANETTSAVRRGVLVLIAILLGLAVAAGVSEVSMRLFDRYEVFAEQPPATGPESRAEPLDPGVGHVNG